MDKKEKILRILCFVLISLIVLGGIFYVSSQKDSFDSEIINAFKEYRAEKIK